MPDAGTIERVELDGRTLEGGGQLIRIALCLSSLTATPIKITHIRGNRTGGGGLKAQHLACVNWLARACNAQVQGAEKGSKTLAFQPGQVHTLSPAFTAMPGPDGDRVYECRLDIGTAGSTGLAVQAILPFILFSTFPSALRIRLTVSGGTNVPGSPSFDYLSQVLLPTLHAIGFPPIRATLGRRGWSHGGSSIGHFTLDIPPRPSVLLPAFHHTPPPDPDTDARPAPPSHLHATFIAPASYHAPFRQLLPTAIAHHFGPRFTPDLGVLTQTCEDSRHDKRLYLLLTAGGPLTPTSTSTPAYVLGSDWLYDRRPRPPADPAATAAEMLARVAAALARDCAAAAYVDAHMRDQLVVFRALARGRCRVAVGGRDRADDTRPREPSLHARTAEWVATRMVGVRFDADGSCEGIGFQGPSWGEGRGEVEGREGEGDGADGLVDGMRRLGVGDAP